jgi:hypothetical protein
VYGGLVDPADVDADALVGSLEGGFPWGLLVVSDQESSEQIPDWRGQGEQVTFTTSSLVVKVEHEQVGLATVHVYKGAGDLSGEPAFVGVLAAPSGVLTVADAVGRQLIQVPGTAGTHMVRIFLNRPRQANHIDVVID